MKKKLLVLSILLLLGNTIVAQSKIRIGFIAGPNYAGYSDISDIGVDSKVAFLAGINSEIRLSDKVFLTADLYFERKRAESGVIAQNLFTGTNIEMIVQNDYVVLPVKVKFEFRKNDTFYLTGGVFAAYLVNSYFYEGFGNTSSSDSFKDMDYGLCLGVGKTFNITPTSRITLEIRESLGVANVSGRFDFATQSIKTNSLSLICGYSFDL